MKFRNLILGFIIGFGTLMISHQQVNASNIIAGEGTFSSAFQPIKVYSDPETTQATGQTLSSSVDSWKVIQSYIDDNAAISVDLGDNQWVKTQDTRTVFKPGSYYLQINSNHQSVPLYKDAVFNSQIATLDSAIDTWKITKVATLTGTGIKVAYDLGNNQWVSAKDVTLIYSVANFQAGTETVNAQGEKTGTILSSEDYQIFDSREIGNSIYVRLGTDNQWVLYRSVV